MKLQRWAAVFAVCVCGQAGAADFSFGSDYWGYQVSGQVDRGGDVLDFERDLDVQAQSHMQYRAAWNTGPGWWKPDLALAYTPIQAGGQNTVATGRRFGPIVFGGGNTTVFGDADLKDLALSLRYPLLRGDTRLWAGLSIKRLNGAVTVRGQNDTQEDRQDINEIFPMLHVAAAMPLASWLTVSGEANAIKYGGNSAWDLRAGFSIGVYGPLGLNAGWQARHYRVESGDYLLDASLSGATAGLYLLLR